VCILRDLTRLTLRRSNPPEHPGINRTLEITAISNSCPNLKDARRPWELVYHVVDQPMLTIKIITAPAKTMIAHKPELGKAGIER
jgi:hypothetical protein